MKITILLMLQHRRLQPWTFLGSETLHQYCQCRLSSAAASMQFTELA